MKFIKLFEEQTAFDEAKSTLNRPNVSLIKTNRKVYSLTEEGGVNANGYSYVDLGLPSRLKWAKYNVGAEKETDAGLYFAWGETTGYTASQVGTDKQFSWSDYKYGNSSSNLTKYNQSDGKTVLESTDDAASQIMGGDWRMPTQNELLELYNNTTRSWVTINGVNGRKFTSKKDTSKYIFIPAAGYYYNGSVSEVGNNGYIWSSTISSPYNNARFLKFKATTCSASTTERCYGMSVRGVKM